MAYRSCCWDAIGKAGRTRVLPSSYNFKFTSRECTPRSCKDSQIQAYHLSDLAEHPARLQPTLGVSSLDLGRSDERPFFFGKMEVPAQVYAALHIMQLSFVRCIASYCSAAGGRFACLPQPSFGRFLPRLGPFGTPDGPFFFLCNQLFPGIAQARVCAQIPGILNGAKIAFPSAATFRSNLPLENRCTAPHTMYASSVVPIEFAALLWAFPP